MRYLKIKEFKAGHWYDESQWLLYAAFNTLTMLFESSGFKYVSWFYEGNTKARRRQTKKLFKLYYWWTKIRPNRLEPYTQGDPNPEFNWTDDEWFEPSDFGKRILFDKMQEAYPEHFKWLNEQHALDEEYKREDDAMLKRLIEVRGLMWT